MTTHTSGAADLPDALRVEAAYSGEKFIGYCLTPSGCVGSTLVWADQAAMPGIRLGDRFTPSLGEVIEYRDIPLHALAAGQAVAPKSAAVAWEYSKIESRIKELMAGTAYPNSTSVAQAMKQLVNELWQEYGDTDNRPAPPAMDGGPAAEVARLVHLRTSRAKRVYVAGPMTGLPEYNFPLFNATAARLRAEGWHVENPAEHGHVEGAGWADYLRYDLSRIVTCGAVHLLPGWSNSKGARLEVYVASVLGLEVQYADGAERAAMDGGDAVDAARYRVLRDADNQLHEDDISVSDSSFNAYFGEDLDNAVDQLRDRARAAQKEGEK